MIPDGFLNCLNLCFLCFLLLLDFLFLLLPHQNGFLSQLLHCIQKSGLFCLLCRNFLQIRQPLSVILQRLCQSFQLRDPADFFQHFLQWNPFLLKTLTFFFQTADSLTHTGLSDICPSRIIFRIDMLQTETVVQHTVCSDSDPVLTKLFDTFTFDDISEEEIDVCLHIRLFCDQFLCQGSFFYFPFCLLYFFCIQNCCPEKFLLIHVLIDFHGSFRVLWFHDQKQLVVSEISFDGIVPAFVPHIQKIRQNLHIDKLAALLMQPVSQLISRFFQFFWIGFSSLFQFF